ncbi:AraC family transcriptional regulator [Flagellimonas nanhaiensis]|uniref:AraC family transcriptional regulator n=1 Tax=Flagellimonas nanhaiensis TaxID=2292706 RepID=A0A371JNV0_9FLAO|nr:AraC family transcriptional regulator [Allomuricauda nanhaiensis]RDY58850.1 AraC family transcriptional regulator [Allomuricauda nanhaiensis]
MNQSEHNKTLYYQKLNRVIEYVHNHLDEKIEIKTLAELSHFSPFHFHRIIKALLGEPIGAYITRTRLETAAKMIRYSELPIEEIAYSVGYETPSSLTKAFKQHFGITPSDYRKTKTFNIKPLQTMEITSLNIKKPKLITLEEQFCIYVSMKGPYNKMDYPGAWETLWNEVKSQKLFTAGIQHFGQPFDDPHVTDEANLRYDACLVIHKDAKPNGKVGTKMLKGGKFAVFLYQGSYKNLSQVYDHIFNNWLLESGEELRDESVRERYLNNAEKTEESKLKTEIYIPIK